MAVGDQFWPQELSGAPKRAFLGQNGPFWRPQEACLPIVDVPVHTVMGMPMTEGMGMLVAFIMGTKKS